METWTQFFLRSVRANEGSGAHRRWRLLSVVIVVSSFLIGSQTSIEAIDARPTNPSLLPGSALDGESFRELRQLELAVNRHRAVIGCRPLVWDEKLARLARRYSETMAEEGFFGHVDPAGDDPFDRMRHAGIRFRAAGENLASGQTRGLQVYGDWMRSPAHRAVIENCAFTHHGIGFYRYRWSYLCARY